MLNKTIINIFYILTSPGIIVHEIAHRLACDMLGIRVYKVCYFQLNHKKLGYITHENIYSIKQDMLIAFAPLILNSIVCIILTFPFMTHFVVLETFRYDLSINNVIYLINAWIGFSAGLHSFPSDTDISYLKATLKKKISKNMRHIILNSLVKIITVANSHLKYLFAQIYTILISLILPFLIFNIFI